MNFHSGAAQLAPLAIVIPIIAAAVLLSVGRWLPRTLIDVLATGTAAATVGLDAALFAHTAGGRVVTWASNWTPKHGHSVGIVLVADRVGSGAALLAGALMLCALVFSWRYFDSVEAHFHALMLLFLAGMTGFALTGDLFDMFVFFELMGAVAYALTGFKVEDPTSVQGALNFGIVNSFGAYLTLMGIGLIYAHTGQLGLAQIGQVLDRSPLDALVVIAFVLVVTGWLVKAAMVPFHFWLADAHAVAPTPVCVMFSGIMVELGVYGVFRVYWTTFSGILPPDDIRRALLVLGILTAVVGAVMCLMQRHLKRLLAYSTIAHVGLFICAAATLDDSGTAGAAVYVLGHAGAKSALFLLAGVILARYGSVDEATLHGKGRDAKATAVLFAVAGLALSGLPPFATSLGKAIGEDALLARGYWIGPVLFVAVSALTGGAVLRAGARIFLGLGPVPAEDQQQTSGDQEERETQSLPRMPATMMLAIVTLVAGCLVCGIYSPITHALGRGATRFVDHAGYAQQALFGRAAHSVALPTGIDWTTLGVALGLTSTVLALLVAALGLYAEKIRRAAERVLDPFAMVGSGLRRLHSGHVGDYITWVFIGVTALAALVGIPLRQ
ncbi:MAG TPA: complex I subunit 5 family protein [Mycobacteriales bacterium]|nr:complex I subunit 5 family protein [Mycobacteriales bacterium]